jgi:hypothetical protein
MPNDQQMITLRKIAVRLRELKPVLERISAEVEREQHVIPERLRRSEIDDEACAICGALSFAVASLDDTVGHIAEVTGEDEPPPDRRRPSETRPSA